MKIESYNVRMDSAGAKNTTSTRTLRVGYTLGNKDLKSLKDNSFSGTFTLLQQENEDETSKEREVKSSNGAPLNLWERMSLTGLQNTDSPISNEQSTVRDIQSVRQQFVLYLWRMLFGDESAKRIQEKYGISDMNQYSQNNAASQANAYMHSNSHYAGAANTITVYGVSENYYLEEQSTFFSSQGNVITSDGRSIDFSLEINMSSRFESYYREESLDVLSMCDPLVLNFEGDIADLSDQKFFFDLDADGTEEEISMLNNGNGFLAYDINNDGIINDGSELFGTDSGDGFADLSKYDSDNNGWIDEADNIFDKLKIWVKTSDGEDKLLSLKDQGVGAIYLGNSTTDFTLRDTLGDTTGAIRKTGIFLYENAMIGTMVHLDIAN